MGLRFEAEEDVVDTNTSFNGTKVRDLVHTIQSLASRDMRILFQNLAVRMDSHSKEGIMQILWCAMSEKDQMDSNFQFKPPSSETNPLQNLGVVDRMFDSFARGTERSTMEEQSNSLIRRSRENVEDSIMQILIQVLQRADRAQHSTNEDST